MHAPTSAAPSRVVALTLLAIASLTVMANATISPSLPALRDHFASTPGIATLAGLVMTLPSLSVVLTGAIAGILCDRIGRRPVLLTAMVLYGLAGASGALASTMNEILAGRILLGIANAGVMTATQALIADLFQGSAREKFTGNQSAAMAVGGIVFLTTGGFLASLDWRYPFFIYLSALVLLPLAMVKLAEPARQTHGTAQASETLPWRFVGGIALLAGFGMLTFYMIPVKLPFYMRELGVASPALAGMAVASCTVTSALVSFNYRRLKGNLSPQAVFALAFGLMAAGYAVIALAPNALIAVGGVSFAGLGLGLLMPNQILWLMSRTPPQARGRAAGLMTTAVFLGQFLSPLFCGPVSEGFGLSNVYGVTALVLAAVSVLMAFLARRATA